MLESCIIKGVYSSFWKHISELQSVTVLSATQDKWMCSVLWHEHMLSALAATDQWPCGRRSAWTQPRQKLSAASDRRRLVWVAGKRVPASNPRSYSRQLRSGEFAGQSSGPMKSGVSQRRNSIVSRALCATLSFWRRYLGEVGKFNRTAWLIYPRHCTTISIKICQHLLKLCTKVFWRFLCLTV